MRIEEIKKYLVDILIELGDISKINANYLSKDVNNYSLDKIPTESSVEKWITGVVLNRDVYSFRSRKRYTNNDIDNLVNIGFFEKFEELIVDKNNKSELPNIDGVEEIKCLTPGTFVVGKDNTAEFDITLQINYRR